MKGKDEVVKFTALAHACVNGLVEVAVWMLVRRGFCFQEAQAMFEGKDYLRGYSFQDWFGDFEDRNVFSTAELSGAFNSLCCSFNNTTNIEGRVSLAHLLLDQGAKLNLCKGGSINGYPIHNILNSSKDPEQRKCILELILQYGGSPDLLVGRSEAPMIFAINAGVQFMEILLDYGAQCFMPAWLVFGRYDLSAQEQYARRYPESEKGFDDIVQEGQSRIVARKQHNMLQTLHFLKQTGIISIYGPRVAQDVIESLGITGIKKQSKWPTYSLLPKEKRIEKLKADGWSDRRIRELFEKEAKEGTVAERLMKEVGQNDKDVIYKVGVTGQQEEEQKSNEVARKEEPIDKEEKNGGQQDASDVEEKKNNAYDISSSAIKLEKQGIAASFTEQVLNKILDLVLTYSLGVKLTSDKNTEYEEAQTAKLEVAQMLEAQGKVQLLDSYNGMFEAVGDFFGLGELGV